MEYNFNNPLAVISSTKFSCVFRALGRCSNNNKSIICNNHKSEIFNLVSRPIVYEQKGRIVNGTKVGLMAPGKPNIVFPFQYKNGEFCMVQNFYSLITQYVDLLQMPNKKDYIIATIISLLIPNYVPNIPNSTNIDCSGIKEYANYVQNMTSILDAYYANLTYTIVDEDDSQTEVVGSKLPVLYKILFYDTEPSSVVSRNGTIFYNNPTHVIDIRTKSILFIGVNEANIDGFCYAGQNTTVFDGVCILSRKVTQLNSETYLPYKKEIAIMQNVIQLPKFC